MKCLGLALVLGVAACATVREEDRASWVGQPVSALQKQPVLLTMQLVKTRADDGTEIYNYVNSRAVSSCSRNGTVFGVTLDMATYNSFTSCMSQTAACNNIFYVKNGIVQEYTPVGSGGARCFTDARLQPNYRGPTNI